MRMIIFWYMLRIKKFKASRNKLPLSEEQAKNYKNPDNDPRGPWTSTDCTAQVQFILKQYENDIFSFDEYSFNSLEVITCHYFGYIPRVKFELEKE